MNTALIWFDRLRARLQQAAESPQVALPGLTGDDAAELDRELAESEVLIIGHDDAQRLIADGDAPDDLRASFSLPFDTAFFLIDAPAKMPGELGEGIRGILVSGADGRTHLRAWFEERRAAAGPRYDFTFSAGEALAGPHKRIADLLCWLSGYVNSPNLLAIRHNRASDIVRRHRTEGKPVLAGYYTFASVQPPRRRRPRRPPGLPKPRVAEVHGHFRRAHWHTLASGLRKAWYPTTWVRPHKRRIPAGSAETKMAV